MSRVALARPAVRPAMKARLVLSGPSGAGKTWTALAIATELAEGGPICVIDTEEESALTYADQYAFTHLPWAAPFDPTELAGDLAKITGQYAVVVIDSLSHFWRGQGGTLDIAAGKFTGWKAARPIQEDLVKAILQAGSHVIVCVRSKMDHVQELENGRQVVKKLGMAAMQDDTFEYEMNVSAEVDMDHKLSISKTRCSALADKTFPANHATDMARTYREWLAGGAPVAPTLAAVPEDLGGWPNAGGAKLAHDALLATIKSLTVEQQDEVRTWRAEHDQHGWRMTMAEAEALALFVEELLPKDATGEPSAGPPHGTSPAGPPAVPDGQAGEGVSIHAPSPAAPPDPKVRAAIHAQWAAVRPNRPKAKDTAGVAVDRAERKAVTVYATKRTGSSNEVTPEELPEVLSAFEAFAAGDLVVEAGADQNVVCVTAESARF